MTHGGTGGGTPGQPATVHGAAMTARRHAVEQSRAGLGTVGMACPPCAHITVAPCCMRNRQGIRQITSSAPSLTVTAGPVMMIVAPWPLLMVMPVSLIEISAPVGT